MRSAVRRDAIAAGQMLWQAAVHAIFEAVSWLLV